jgi:hypothetical protein
MQNLINPRAPDREPFDPLGHPMPTIDDQGEKTIERTEDSEKGIGYD